MALKARLRKNIHDWGATVAGILMALGTAWGTIDFSTFDIKTDWKRLIIPTMIALGGYFSKFKQKEDGTREGKQDIKEG